MNKTEFVAAVEQQLLRKQDFQRKMQRMQFLPYLQQ